uniref:Uncharacterized protein n=1 Tax=Rangifer tarandus platyrhynchus TaxID=3082113 RepID=A0ACB0F2C1_RANTA|nr:unnamed protein product [Rangifer tarandus platyrhynchus]
MRPLESRARVGWRDTPEPAPKLPSSHGRSGKTDCPAKFSARWGAAGRLLPALGSPRSSPDLSSGPSAKSRGRHSDPSPEVTSSTSRSVSSGFFRKTPPKAALSFSSRKCSGLRSLVFEAQSRCPQTTRQDAVSAAAATLDPDGKGSAGHVGKI